MINFTEELDANEINRKMREIYSNAKQIISGVMTESEKMDIAMMRFKNTLISTVAQTGNGKELAQIELDKKATLAAIDQEERGLAEKYAKQGEFVPEEQKQTSSTHGESATNVATSETLKVADKYAEETEAIYIKLGNVWLTEEEKKREEIKRTFDGIRKELLKGVEGGDVPEGEYLSRLKNIDMAEEQTKTKFLLDQYKSYSQQREEIEKKFNDAITKMQAKNVDGKYDANIGKAKEQKKASLSGLDTEELKKGLNWEAVFRNLDKVSTQSLTNVRNSLKEYMSTAKESLSPTALKMLTDAYEQLNEKIDDRTPGEAFKAAFANYKKANDELKKAREDEKKASGTEQETEAQKKAREDEKKASGTEQETEAQKKVTEALNARRAAQIELNKAIHGYTSKSGEVLESANALTGMLENFGINIPESIKGALNGIGQVVEGLASIDVTKPFSIITGVFKMVGGVGKAIFSIFNGDNQKEKEIQHIQDQVDTLQKSYEVLSDSIEKAYSTDAKGLIEDQNKMLEQQNALINNQIAEEKAKKDTDWDQINEMNAQIQENNKLIEENKEKAIDAIFGEDLNAAIENFATAYANAWAKGDDKAESAKDAVRKMMRQMVTESIKAAIQSSGDMEKIRKKLEEFYADNVLTGWEQDYIYNMAEDLQKNLDRQFGWADSLMTDEKDTSQQEDVESQQDTTSKGLQTMSQDTGNELNGRFTVMTDIMYKSMMVQEYIRETGLNIADATFNIRDLAIQANSHLYAIRNSTNELYEINRRLKGLEEIKLLLK